MKTHSRIIGYSFLVVLVTTFSACHDFMSSSNKPEQNSNLGISSSTVDNSTSKKFITANPKAFAEKLSSLNNENEVLIVLKTASAPRISKAMLKELPIGGKMVVALPETEASVSQRSKPGFAPVNVQSRQSIKAILSAHDIQNIVAADFGNVINVKLPPQKALPVLVALMNNPSVDYIEANLRYPVDLGGSTTIIKPFTFNPARIDNRPVMLRNPEGSNPADAKHTYHDVLDAWDYTRGSGVRVGILDTGFAFDQATNSYHPDGQLLSSSKGIKKLGFVDDYGSDDPAGDNCNGGSGQPYGNCLPWDDNGHGTWMAGLVGANDNNLVCRHNAGRSNHKHESNSKLQAYRRVPQ